MRGAVLAAALLFVPLAPPVWAAEDSIALGKELYIERCVLCHGSKGHGWEWTQKVMTPLVPVPNLAETVPNLDDEYLRQIILDGGEAVGRTHFMPAFRFRMNDQEEVEALIKYLRAISGAAKAR